MTGCAGLSRSVSTPKVRRVDKVITFPLLLDDVQMVDTPVDIIDLSAPGWRTSTGRVAKAHGELYEITLDDPSVPSPLDGARVVLNLKKGSGERHTADVVRSWAGGFEAKKRRTKLPERRVYPRLMGGIPMAYKIIPRDEPAAAAMVRKWVAGFLPEPDETWATPDPLMNFSVTGICFEDVYPGEAPPGVRGDVFLGWMGVGSDTQRYRVAGHIVRVEAIPPEEQKISEDPGSPTPTHRIAIQFSSMGEEAVEALTSYTLKLQLANL